MHCLFSSTSIHLKIKINHKTPHPQDWVQSQLNVATRFLKNHKSDVTKRAIEARVAELRTRAAAMTGTCRFGDHHLVVAVPDTAPGLTATAAPDTAPGTMSAGVKKMQ
jgi:hypothetical protein